MLSFEQLAVSFFLSFRLEGDVWSWEGASATIFDCDGTYLANVTLEDVNSETVRFCLPGASDYG